ncbi:unnamed protein product, partial [Strongylus vulgaris]
MIHLDGETTEVDWFSATPSEAIYRHDFDSSNESSFVGHVFLCVPGQTSKSPTCERTDGVVIVYPNFVQSVFLPDSLKGRNPLLLNKIVPISASTKVVGHVQSVFLPDSLKGRNPLLLNKIVPIPASTKVVGHACDERFCYVMTFDGAISCVRLLPKGFDDDLSDDNSFIDELCTLRDSFSQDDEPLS